jgi:hypothetical protein
MVPRGIYRWLELKEGPTAWYVRIDRSSGEWDTLTFPQYLEEKCVPPFWDLPLKDDHLNGVMGELGGGS